MKTKIPFLVISALVALLLLAVVNTNASAAPAVPIDIILTQPDGTTFTARQWGDEWNNGIETIEGFSILQQEDSWWVYAEMTANGGLSPALGPDGSLKVGLASPEGLRLHARPPQVVPEDIVTLEDFTQEFFDEEFLSEEYLEEDLIVESENIGTQPTLILLASFSNRSGTYTAANFASSMFGGTNSVKDFYLKASFNQLVLAPAAESDGTANDGVVGWLNLGYAHPNTGGSTGSANQWIVKNVLIAADPFVNFASFDTNGNGYISINELHIVVVVAGYESSYGTTTPCIWAHRWNLNIVTPPNLDTKILGDYFHNGGYAQFGEIHGTHQATIGIMAHEFGHDVTWPDLYDYDDSSEGVGNWSLMGGGSWNYTGSNYHGSSPSLPDAWLKWYQGWITPTAVSGTMTGASIPQAETNAKAFLLRPNTNGVDWDFMVKSGAGEFFLVENRQLTEYDAGLPGCGLNIWHIDESVISGITAPPWPNDNENQPLVKLMEADGLNDLKLGTDRGDVGDPFPGSTGNKTFNYSSNPNSRLYSGSDSLVSVTSISNCSATMTATLQYGSDPTLTKRTYLPLLLKPADVVETDPIKNGTFESGQTGWTEYSTHGWDVVIIESDWDVDAYAGSWLAWLGGDFNDTSYISQSVKVPSTLKYLHYRYDLAGTETTCGNDVLRIKFDTTTVLTKNLCTSTYTGGWVGGVVNMGAYSGQTKALKFEVVTNGTLNSNAFMDNIAFTSVATASPEVELSSDGDQALAEKHK